MLSVTKPEKGWDQNPWGCGVSCVSQRPLRPCPALGPPPARRSSVASSHGDLRGLCSRAPPPFLLLAGLSLLGLCPGAFHVDISPHPQRSQRHRWASCPSPALSNGPGKPDFIAQ